MSTFYQVQISVRVHDLAVLRAFAFNRAVRECQMTESEFANGEHDDPEANVGYWLAWAFDAGTPPDCGFDIEDSQAVYEGSDTDFAA